MCDQRSYSCCKYPQLTRNRRALRKPGLEYSDRLGGNVGGYWLELWLFLYSRSSFIWQTERRSDGSVGSGPVGGSRKWRAYHLYKVDSTLPVKICDAALRLRFWIVLPWWQKSIEFWKRTYFALQGSTEYRKRDLSRLFNIFTYVCTSIRLLEFCLQKKPNWAFLFVSPSNRVGRWAYRRDCGLFLRGGAAGCV